MSAEHHPKRVIGIFRFTRCRGRCAAQTCHTYRGNRRWTCDTCEAERVENVWVCRPVFKKLEAW